MDRNLVLFLIGAAAIAALAWFGVGRRDGDFITRQNFRVTPGPQEGQFTVLGTAGAAGPDFFCAAAEYAWRRLDVPQSQRIVTVSPVARSPDHGGRRSTVFAVVAPEDSQSNESLQARVDRAGESLTIAHALTLCRDS